MPNRVVKDRTQIVPFPDASDLQFRIARSFALITDWNAALSGHYLIQDVLAVMARQVGSANVALYRFADGTAQSVSNVGPAYNTDKWERSSGLLTKYLRDKHAAALEPGSIWRLTELRNDPDFQGSPADREWAARPHMIEVSVIVLESTRKQTDVLEVWFDTPPNRSAELPTSIITQAMANAWEVRTPGLIARLIRSYGRNRAQSDDPTGAMILGEGNPCGLSRAELRVCQLLAAGDNARKIADGLSLSVPTVRTHMRNIYAKTNTSGQVELISVINDGAWAE